MNDALTSLSARLQSSKGIHSEDSKWKTYLAGAAQSGRRGLSSAGVCTHWLPPNRFDWFDKSPPDDGTIAFEVNSSKTNRRDGSQALRAEFCSPLSTAISADSADLLSEEYGQFISWGNQPEFSSPNAIPGIELTVRPNLERSPAFLLTRRLNFRGRDGIDGTGVDRKVLILGMDPNFQEAESLPDASLLWIDFIVPQRAVALEFGFLGEDDATIEGRHVEMVGYDRFDNPFVTSHANEFLGQRDNSLPANTINFLIGVRSAEGELASVSLRFTGAQNRSKPQAIARIWHEPLPPAAVLQGTLVTEGGKGSFAPFVADGFHLEDPKDRDGVTIPFRDHRTQNVTMPFHCDRGVVMLRGFKLQFLDQSPHEFTRLAVEVNPWQVGGSAYQSPGDFSVLRGSTITLEPNGSLYTRERGVLGFRVYIHYTLIVWDSEQVDLSTVCGEISERGLKQDELVEEAGLVLADPCSTVSGQTPGIDCGNLFGALQGFELRTPEDQEWELVRLICGRPGGAPDGGTLLEGSGHGVEDITAPDLRREARGLSWSFGSWLQGGDNYTRRVRGTVLTGGGLRLQTGNTSIGVILDPVGYRPDSQTFFPFDPLPHADIDGDIGFVGLGAFTFAPDGPLREVELELLGDDYDGQTVTWKAAAGISTQPLITGGAGFFFSPAETFGIAFPFPVFGALSRRQLVPRMQVAVHDMVFEGHMDTISSMPTQFGVVHNLGNLPLILASFRQQGPEYASFAFRFSQRGVSSLPSMPLVLAVGESLVIGGIFYPSEPPLQGAIFRARLDFETNIGQSIQVLVTGTVTASSPSGMFIGEALDFGIVNLRSQRRMPTHNALLFSNGESPLVLQPVTIAYNTSDGGSFVPRVITPLAGNRIPPPGARYQLDSGDTMLIEIAIAPIAVGIIDASLIFQSNAGPISTRILAQITDE